MVRSKFKCKISRCVCFVALAMDHSSAVDSPEQRMQITINSLMEILDKLPLAAEQKIDKKLLRQSIS